MEMPKPGAAHAKLSDLVGEWRGEETLHPSPWDTGGPATGRVTNRWIVDGFAIHQEYEQIRNGKVTFRGHGVIWYDPGRDEYVMHWWDSMGGAVNEYRGTLEGGRLTLSAPMPQGGHSRTSWLLAPGSHDFLMEISPDGSAWQAAMEGRYTKAAKPAGRRAAAKAAVKKAAAPRAAGKKAAGRTAAPKTGKKATARASGARTTRGAKKGGAKKGGAKRAVRGRRR